MVDRFNDALKHGSERQMEHTNQQHTADTEDERWVGEGGGSSARSHEPEDDPGSKSHGAEIGAGEIEPGAESEAAIPGVEMANDEGVDPTSVAELQNDGASTVTKSARGNVHSEEGDGRRTQAPPPHAH